MPTLIACPQCGAVAEITDRCRLTGTSGPVEHVALRCARRHLFRMPTDLLPRAAQKEIAAGPADPHHLELVFEGR
jgi:hypothetical protein